MGTKIYSEEFNSQFKTSQHTLDLLDSVPDAMYWVDHNCQFVGCNNHFFELLNVTVHKKLTGTPYDWMMKHTPWTKERIDAFKLDDMKVIFSGEPLLNFEEPPVYDKKNNPIYFKSHRVPILNHSNHVIGLAVTFTNVTEFSLLKKQLIENDKKNQVRQNTKVAIKEEPRVLMVEDNEVAQQVELALLEGLNCQVDIASTGDEALKLFDPGKYDMILMDIGLEDTSGYMVAKNIRDKEKTTEHHVPILALTSFKADVIKHDCKEYFMEGVLSKPITNKQAEQLIKHYVNHEDVDVDGLETASDD